MACRHEFYPSAVDNYEVCGICGTYHSLIAPSPSAIYSTGYWDGIKRSTLVDQDYNISKHLEGGLPKNEFLRNLIWTQDRSAAFEIGCAPGTLLRMLRYGAGFERVVGIDVDRACESAIREIGCEDAELVFGFFPSVTARRKPGMFSLILAADVFEHIHSPEDFLKECARLLKPDGQLLLMTPLLVAEDEQLPERFFEPIEHVFIYSRCQVEAMLDDAGFINHSVDRWALGHDTITSRRK